MVSIEELEDKIHEEEVKARYDSLDRKELNELDKAHKWYVEYTKKEYQPISYQVNQESQSAPQFGITDKLITLSVLIGISIPSFFLGMMMILFFSVQLRWFPVSGMWPIYGARDLSALLSHLFLPAVALSVVATGVIARLSRSAMLEVLRQDFIRTARAKGLSEARVIWRHALKAAMVSVIPVLGVQAGFVLSGAVYIEMVFQWPGVGRMLVEAILKRDILLVQGGVVFVAACYVMFNIVVDIIQSLLDPRIKT